MDTFTSKDQINTQYCARDNRSTDRPTGRRGKREESRAESPSNG